MFLHVFSRRAVGQRREQRSDSHSSIRKYKEREAVDLLGHHHHFCVFQRPPGCGRRLASWTFVVVSLCVVVIVSDARGAGFIKWSPSATRVPHRASDGDGNPPGSITLNSLDAAIFEQQDRVTTLEQQPRSSAESAGVGKKVADADVEDQLQDLHPQSSSPSVSFEDRLNVATQKWKQYQQDLYESTTPDASLTTGAFTALQFTNGYRNQATIFCWVMMEAMDKNISQILLPSLRWRDYLGSDTLVRHEDLFDVVHWNSFYPALPRLVRWDPAQHPHLLVNTSVYRQQPSESLDNYFFGQDYTEIISDDLSPFSSAVTWAEDTPKRNVDRRPKTVGPRKHMLMYLGRYNSYVKSVESGERPNFHPADALIMRQSSPDRPFRPHPVLRYMMEEHMATGTVSKEEQRRALGHASRYSKDDKPPSSNYLAVHARIEPDMQRHPKCQSKKVRLLQEIIEKIYTVFPNTPPMSSVLVVLSRRLLEDEVQKQMTNSSVSSSSEEQDGLAAQNLGYLNRLVQDGMWNGTVSVVEGGMNVFRQDVEHQQDSATATSETASSSEKEGSFWENLKGFYRSKPLIVGAIVDFSLSIDARWFVGTEVSTFSRDIFAARLNDDNKTEERDSSQDPASEDGNQKNYVYLPKHDLQSVMTVAPFHC